LQDKLRVRSETARAERYINHCGAEIFTKQQGKPWKMEAKISENFSFFEKKPFLGELLKLFSLDQHQKKTLPPSPPFSIVIPFSTFQSNTEANKDETLNRLG
jgi:hypothetical protein